jgi:hypothetical protein
MIIRDALSKTSRGYQRKTDGTIGGVFDLACDSGRVDDESFKAKVALAALKGEKTLAELAQEAITERAEAIVAQLQCDLARCEQT